MLDLQAYRELRQLAEQMALQGHHARWLLRAGDYRIVYTVEDDQLIVWVLAAGNRRDVYRGL